MNRDEIISLLEEVLLVVWAIRDEHLEKRIETALEELKSESK